MSKRVEETVQDREEAECQCRLLLRVDLLFSGHSDRPLHADFRGEPHVRLDRAHSGAISQQPPDPSARRISGQPGRACRGFRWRTALMDERAYYSESPTTKPANAELPVLQDSQRIRTEWLLRKKKDRLPPGGDERDRAKFAKAQSYMLLLDDKADCKNPRCRRQFRSLRRQDRRVSVSLSIPC